jgi:hypothetical protein
MPLARATNHAHRRTIAATSSRNYSKVSASLLRVGDATLWSLWITVGLCRRLIRYRLDVAGDAHAVCRGDGADVVRSGNGSGDGRLLLVVLDALAGCAHCVSALSHA